MVRRIVSQAGLLSTAIFFLASCASTISPFDPKAYENAVSLKVGSLSLMDQAVEPYNDHQNAVENLSTDLQKAFEYAKGLPKNEISAAQWRIMIDPERNLLGGFLKRWAEKDTLSPVFVEDAKKLVSDAFDTIIGLESGKIKSSDVR